MLLNGLQRERSDLSSIKLLIMMLMLLEVRIKDFNSKMATWNKLTEDPDLGGVTPEPLLLT